MIQSSDYFLILCSNLRLLSWIEPFITMTILRLQGRRDPLRKKSGKDVAQQDYGASFGADLKLNSELEKCTPVKAYFSNNWLVEQNGGPSVCDDRHNFVLFAEEWKVHKCSGRRSYCDTKNRCRGLLPFSSEVILTISVFLHVKANVSSVQCKRQKIATLCDMMTGRLETYFLPHLARKVKQEEKTSRGRKS